MNSQQEAQWRLFFFVAGVILFFGAGLLVPFRRQPWRLHWRRWTRNMSLTFLNSLMVRGLFGTALYQAAQWSQDHRIGFLAWESVEAVIGRGVVPVIVSAIILDLVIYWQHRLFHRMPLLWRLHRMHHTDPEFDTTTALRFHPLEIALSVLIKMATVVLLAADPLSILVFEIALNFSAMFNHANISLPAGVERLLRRVLVTPDLHRIHHSVRPQEHHQNFGFCLSIWDKMFKSLVTESRDNPKTMAIGVESFPNPLAQETFYKLIEQPWQK